MIEQKNAFDFILFSDILAVAIVEFITESIEQAKS